MMRSISKKFNELIPKTMSNVFAYVENQAKHLDNAMYPDRYAKPRRPVGSSTPSECHPNLQKPPSGWFKDEAQQLVHIFHSAWQSYRYFKSPVQATRAVVSAELLEELELMARSMGASAIGYAKVTPDMIFEDMAIAHENAIVIISEMDREAVDKAPHADVLLEVERTYATTTDIANALTQRLRDEGYSAYAGVAIGGAVDHVRLAAKANLGAIGYHGLLISPYSGARLRINVLYTNIINLPFAETNDHEWVLSFCAMCKKCIRSCPAKAIKLDPPSDVLGRKSVLHNKQCADYMAANYTCSICMSVCPFSRAGYDKIKANFKGERNQNQHRQEKVTMES